MSAASPAPRRGEVWDIDFAPTRGHEQSGHRPALVISSDQYNRSPSGLVVVLPITKARRRVPWHLDIPKGKGGMTFDSVILCDHVRSVSLERFIARRGDVGDPVLEEAQRLLKYLLEIP